MDRADRPGEAAVLAGHCQQLRGALARQHDGEPIRPAQRIGLSATVRPAQEVAAFLGGPLPVTIVQPPSDKRLELTIVVPVQDMSDLQSADGAGGGWDTAGPGVRVGSCGGTGSVGIGQAVVARIAAAANPANIASDGSARRRHEGHHLR